MWTESKLKVTNKTADRLGVPKTTVRALNRGLIAEVTNEELIRMSAGMILISMGKRDEQNQKT